MLNVDIRPDHFGGTVLSTLEGDHSNYLVIDLAAVELGDCVISGLGSFIVHIAVAFRVAIIIVGDLAREYVSKHREGVKESLVVDTRSEVFYKDVANTGFTQRWVSLRPHDAARLSLDISEVHSVKGSFRIHNVVEVDIGIPKTTTGNRITADTNRGYSSNTVENFKEKSFSDLN